MSDNRPFFIISVVVIAVFMCFGLFISSITPQKTEEEIVMVQPCGWFWCAGYDAQYAEHVNLPNSQANQNNAKGELYLAQAEKIMVEVEKEQAQVNAMNGLLGLSTAMFGLVVLGGIVFGVILFGKKA